MVGAGSEQEQMVVGGDGGDINDATTNWNSG